MTKDEALRLALRAMVVNNQAWKHLADSGDAGFWEAEEQGFYQLNEQAITAVEAALEAKDEPVALKPCGYESKETKMCRKCGQVHAEAIWDTIPLQRTWVGLTDEHKEGLICMTDPNPEPHHLRELIDVVEFQLKERNT